MTRVNNLIALKELRSALIRKLRKAESQCEEQRIKRLIDEIEEKMIWSN